MSHGRVNQIIAEAQQKGKGRCWMDFLQDSMSVEEIALCKQKMRERGYSFFTALTSFRCYE